MDSTEIFSLYYDEEENYMVDQEGEIVYDIFRIISPGRLEYMKQKRGVEYIRGVKPGVIYELDFPLFDDEC